MPRQRREDPGLGEPNLTPIMSTICILIPLLIYSYNFFEIKVQDISLPKFGQSSGGGPSKVLNLALLVAKDQFIIKIQGGGKEAREITIKKKAHLVCDDPTLPCDQCTGREQDGYDYPGLYTQMVKLKDSEDFRDVDSINIGADDGIPWKVLARTIDSVRTRLAEDKYETLCLYGKAAPKIIETTDADGNIQKKAAELFPKIVFVML